MGQDYTDVTFDAPQVAGAVWVEGDLIPPPGWICWPIELCYTYNDYRFHETVLVGLFQDGEPELMQLPLQSPYYIIARNTSAESAGGDPGHGSDSDEDTSTYLASYGIPWTINVITSIASLYKSRSADELSINDVSLPEGGLFDIHDDWNVPHVDHRLGIAFDVNRYDASGAFVPCSTDFALRKAVKTENSELLQLVPSAPLPPVHIVCEGTEGRIHVNVNDPFNEPAFRA